MAEHILCILSLFSILVSMVNVASGGQSSTAAMGAGVTEDQFTKHWVGNECNCMPMYALSTYLVVVYNIMSWRWWSVDAS